MKKEIRVLVVEPMRKPYVKTIPDTLEAIYQVYAGCSLIRHEHQKRCYRLQ